MNHSENPNVKMHENGSDMVAARDIEILEELTCNYYEFDEEPESNGPLLANRPI